MPPVPDEVTRREVIIAFGRERGFAPGVVVRAHRRLFGTLCVAVESGGLGVYYDDPPAELARAMPARAPASLRPGEVSALPRAVTMHYHRVARLLMLQGVKQMGDADQHPIAAMIYVRHDEADAFRELPVEVQRWKAWTALNDYHRKHPLDPLAAFLAEYHAVAFTLG